MRAAIESLRMAVQFLTRLPAGSTAHLTGEAAAIRLRQSLLWFPLVGGAIGGLSAATLLLAGQLWPPIVAVLLALIVEAWVTGGFHEDAVADFSDAMGGGRTREDKLRILKDSRIGSYGALALMLAVGLRAGLLLALPPALLAPALIAAGAIGRWTILLVIARITPVAGRDGLARDMAGRIGFAGVAAALALAAPALAWSALIAPVKLVAALLAAIAFAVLFARWLYRVLGGSTGDCLGFAAYAGMLLALLAFAADPA